MKKPRISNLGNLQIFYYLYYNGKSLFVFRLSRQPFIQSTSYLAGVLLRKCSVEFEVLRCTGRESKSKHVLPFLCRILILILPGFRNKCRNIQGGSFNCEPLKMLITFFLFLDLIKQISRQ